MIRKILVALDNSDFAHKVMLQALELAKVYQAQLFAVSVINYSVVLDKCKQLAGEFGIDYLQDMLSGHPAEEIIKYAEENSVDLIVVGHIGKSGAAGLILGSVSQKVSAHSKCSVVIVK
ncbi:MAG: universal stress protein [Firmicutes bacterium]|nr:universal stress protein [Bacillota bacterium]